MAVAQTITGSFEASYAITEQLVWGLNNPDTPQGSDSSSLALNNGNGGNGVIDLHCELGIKTPITLAAGASVTYTLSALTDDLGRSVAFAYVLVWYLRITTITVGDYLTITPGVTHGWTALFSGTGHKCKRCVLAMDDGRGFQVTAGANDQITITNSGANPISFILALAGTSA